MCRFIWREQLQPAIHSFKRTGFFWRISLSLLFFHVGWLISRNSCCHPFFQGLYGTDNFWQRLLTKSVYFFGGAIDKKLKIYSHPLLPTHFLWVHLRIPVKVNKLLIKAAIFSEQHQLYWNESSHLKQLPSCLVQLLLANTYFLVINTFSDQLLASEELLLQNK